MYSELFTQLKEAFSERQLFLVGGAVRDTLLVRHTQDLDFATDSLPQETRRRVESWADAVWSVGEKFGTIGLAKDGFKAEITTFRSDVYDGEGRHPRVSYGKDIFQDLARRDFTINALAQNVHTQELIDPYKGRDDLRDRRVRFVGRPEDRIREDPLRMLRAVRFCAQLGFSLETGTEAAIARLVAEISRISWERIRDEYDAILLCDNAAAGLRLLLKVGLAHHTLPELEDLNIPQNPRYHLKDVLEHTLESVELAPPEKNLRWTMLLHDISKPETFTTDENGIHFYRHEDLGAERAAHILTRLRQPAELIAAVQKLIRSHLRIPMYKSEWSDAAVRRLMFDLGEHFEDAVEVAKADVEASHVIPGDNFEARLTELLARAHAIGEAAELAKMKPLLRGEEVMELLQIDPGPRVGEVQRFLLSQQIEGTILTAEDARQRVLKEFGPNTQKSEKS